MRHRTDPPRNHRMALLLVDQLSSLRFARGLLIAICFVALVGTVIPQQEAPATYLSRFGPKGAVWLTRFGLTDLYQSWYFAGLMVLLGISLTVCSIRRWAGNLKTLGSIAMHLGFVLIIAGGLIRHMAGLEGVVELREGEQTSRLKVTETRTQTLPFTIHLEDFDFERAQGHPAVTADVVSHIRLIEAGKDERAVVRVNHPITHRGFRIYQLGFDPDDRTMTALLFVKDPSIPIVYTGFGLLLGGLLTTFYLAPLAARWGVI